MLLVLFPSDSYEYLSVAIAVFLKSKSHVAPLLKLFSGSYGSQHKALISPVKEFGLRSEPRLQI